MDRETDQRLKIIFKIFLRNEEEGIFSNFARSHTVGSTENLIRIHRFILYLCLGSTETHIRRWKLFSSCRQRKMLRFRYLSFRKS